MHYRERLSVPGVWWLLSLLFALSLLLAFGFYLGPVWGVAGALVSFAATAVLFTAAAIRIEVTDTSLLVGRAHLEGRYLARATALDAIEARRRRGPEADARAYLMLRPYVSTAVLVRLADPDDPAPYWLVATRRPRALAAAIGQIQLGGMAAASSQHGGHGKSGLH